MWRTGVVGSGLHASGMASTDLRQGVRVSGQTPVFDEERIRAEVRFALAGQNPLPPTFTLRQSPGLRRVGEQVEPCPPPLPDQRQGPLVVAVCPVPDEALADGSADDVP